MGKKVKKNKGIKRLYDLEIDEVSLVDKPAIGEEFYVTKRVSNKGANVAKKKGKKKPVLTKALSTWQKDIKKNADKCGEQCHFCGITKEQENESIGAGLRCSVCIECALEHYEKGVFDECCTFSFDIDKFKESYPDVELFQKDDDSDGEDDDEDGDSDDEGESNEDESEDYDSEDSDEDESDDESEDDDKNKSSDEKPASDDDEEDDSSQESGEEGLQKRVVKLEKNLEEVSDMLSRSLELHDVAAGALNEVISLTFASLDALMMMMEEQMDEGGEQAQQQSDLFGEIMDSIKSVRSDITKRGAKISARRMRMLRDIAEKLSQLIESVSDAKKGVSKQASEDILQKSLESLKDELKETVSNFKRDIEEQLKSVTEKVSDIEQSGGASHNLDEDDEEEDDEEEAGKSQSLFSDVVGLNDIAKSIKEKDRRRRQ